MRKILFVSQQGLNESACGVFLIGRQYSQLLRQSEMLKILRVNASSINDVYAEITASNPLAVIINFHPVTTPWASADELKNKFPHIPFIKFDHDMTQKRLDMYTPDENQGFDYCISPDTTLTNTNEHVFQINRMMGIGSPIDPPEKHCPWIGYQGFAFEHKGIQNIVKQVVKEFDEAYIRLHMPYSTYGDQYGYLAHMQAERAQKLVQGTNIKVFATHNLMSSEQLVQWLSQNDVNCYFYDENIDFGIASAPDYAIAARRPLAVRKSNQLRYIWSNVPSSAIEKNSLRNIIANGFAPFEGLYNKMSDKNILSELENIIINIIESHTVQS